MGILFDWQSVYIIFHYMMEMGETNGDNCVKHGLHWPSDFITGGYAYDKIKNSLAMLAWAINTEKEYIIAYEARPSISIWQHL